MSAIRSTWKIWSCLKASLPSFMVRNKPLLPLWYQLVMFPLKLLLLPTLLLRLQKASQLQRSNLTIAHASDAW